MAALDPGESFGPERIRALRGEASRAAFAREVGVTAQTVYRWELPDSAPEARRPRGKQLARLSLYARSAGELGPPPSAAGVAASPPPVLTHPPPSWADADVSRVLPALARMLRGDLRRGHAELLQIVANARALSADARAAAHYGIALYELLDRANARAALTAIAPLLGEAEDGRLSADIAAKLFGVAALCHASTDVLLFDLGKVHAYQARAEQMSDAIDADAACLGAIAALWAATLVGDQELLGRAFSRLEETRWNGLPALLEYQVEEFRLLRLIYSGKSAASVEACAAAAERAEGKHPLLLVRALNRLAIAELDMLADPERVLERVRRAKAIARSARLGPGFHHVLGLRTEIDALTRLGRMDEALLAYDEVEAWTAETGIPALPAVTAQARLQVLLGQVEPLQVLAAQLRSCELPSLRPICEAYACFVDGCAAFTTTADPALTIALFGQAETLAVRWPFLLREVLLFRVYAYAASGDEVGGQVALRRAQRYVDGLASPWFSAHLRRLDGGFLAARGRWQEGRQLLESAAATFDLAKDKSDAALTRYLGALIARSIDPSEAGRVEAAEAELRALGLALPQGMQSGVARFSAQRPPQPTAALAIADAERLIVPFQRVAMRGAAPMLILSELSGVASELFGGRPVTLEEIDSAGGARLLLGSSAGDGEVERVEFSDGAGRVLRIGVRGRLEPGERAALSLLAMTAALALEVAVLRNIGEHAAGGGGDLPVPELPGFVAASAEMHRLRAELVRLSRSRSTVIITGESGAGKELVARAIHDLSERSSQPYVAFNCATVPRELFEGQLFGYRRGAFTGATADRPGVIRAANRGTLFLDEIGELPLDIQPKLLRFLENAEVFPLGERAPVRVDVRVLAATHRDLAQLVREGRFREDLYYRLQVVPIHVPPLRERRADIPVLARHFLRELSRPKEPAVLAPDAVAALLEQRFPGNVRELKNVIERAIAFHPDQPVLRAEHLGLPVPARAPPAS